jgi:hypothetical protein
MARISFFLLAGLCCLFTAVQEVRADEILLVNGDRISGEILYITAGEIQIKTEFAEKICICSNRSLFN